MILSREISDMPFTFTLNVISAENSPFGRRSLNRHKSPTAIKLGRAAFMRTNDLDYRRGIAIAVEDFCNAAMTPDAHEGLRAFLEKRKPNWN